jgi:hypothetical protein
MYDDTPQLPNGDTNKTMAPCATSVPGGRSPPTASGSCRPRRACASRARAPTVGSLLSTRLSSAGTFGCTVRDLFAVGPSRVDLQNVQPSPPPVGRKSHKRSKSRRSE